jgi:hypothetical protein
MRSHYSVKCSSFIPLRLILLFKIIPQITDVIVTFWYKYKNSNMAEITLWQSQPYTNSHFHFHSTVELVFLRWPKQMTVHQAKVRTIRWMLQKIPVKWLQQFFYLMCAVWGCTVMIKHHTSQQTSRCLPVNSLTQSQQSAAEGTHIYCCATKHKILCGWLLPHPRIQMP